MIGRPVTVHAGNASPFGGGFELTANSRAPVETRESNIHSQTGPETLEEGYDSACHEVLAWSKTLHRRGGSH